MRTYANAVLASNGTPQRQVNRVRVPIRSTADVVKARMDLYQRVTVYKDGAAVGVSFLRVTAIEHTITPEGWYIDLTFEGPNSTAMPQKTSPVQQLAPATPGSEPAVVPVGSVQMYAGGSAPYGWLVCDGSAVSRTTYAALYAVLGNAFGAGDGSNTFNLPDFRHRFIVCAGSNRGLGANEGVIEPNRDPGHTHNASGLSTVNPPNTVNAPNSGSVAAPRMTSFPLTVTGNTGGGGGWGQTPHLALNL